MYIKTKKPCLIYNTSFFIDVQIYVKEDGNLIKCGTPLSKHYTGYPLDTIDRDGQTHEGLYKQLVNDISLKIQETYPDVLGAIESLFDEQGNLLIGMVFVGLEVVLDCRAVNYTNELFRSSDWYDLGVKGINYDENIYKASRRVEPFTGEFFDIPFSWFEIQNDILGVWYPECISSEVSTSVRAPYNKTTRNISSLGVSTVIYDEPYRLLDIQWNAVPLTQIKRPQAIGSMDRMYIESEQVGVTGDPNYLNPWLSYSTKKGMNHPQTLSSSFYDLSKANGALPIYADLGISRYGDGNSILRQGQNVATFETFNYLDYPLEDSFENYYKMRSLIVDKNSEFRDVIGEISHRYYTVNIPFMDITPEVVRVSSTGAFRRSDSYSISYPFKDTNGGQ